MYSTTIESKVDVMFHDLKMKVATIVGDASTPNEAITNVTKIVSSELATRSKSILSDMLFDLSDTLMSTDFFAEVERKNRFTEINLRYEILNKYQFAPSTTVNYEEASGAIQALKLSGATFVVGGVVEIGVILVTELPISSLVPIPIALLVVASIGAALASYYAIEPAKNKKTLRLALEQYLDKEKKQFLNWFDEVEKYFDMRVEEIKQQLEKE